MFQRIKTLVDHWHELREVESLTDRDLDDLGMTREQVEAFVRMPNDVPDRVAAMARIFGLTDEELKANHEAYMDLLHTCSHCKARRACSVVLERAEFATPQDVGFCMNKHSLGMVSMN